MKKHNGMRPHDIAVLLKIVSLETSNWLNKDLAASLQISPSEISESLGRSVTARLIDQSKKHVHPAALHEFLVHGLKYVFPVVPGALVRGIPTAHSAKPVSEYLVSGDVSYVMPSAKGQVKGQAIEPLYKNLPGIVTHNTRFYELIALADALRVGRAREIKIADEALQKYLF